MQGSIQTRSTFSLELLLINPDIERTARIILFDIRRQGTRF